MSGNTHRAIIVALAANLAIALTKGAAALFTGSGAMLAETVHSFADCGNQLLLLLGLRQADRPASPDYPLGHGKAIYFWSFLVAVMLFTVGGMFSLYEGVHKLQHPEPLTQWGWAVGILVFSLVAEGVSTRAALQEAGAERRGRSMWRWFRESRQAELIVVVGENMAAMCGLAVALVAIGLTVVTGNPLWDALGTILIGALLIVVAVFVAIEIKAMLIGQSIDPARQAEMHAFIASQPGVEGLLSLITLQMGSDVVVSAHVQMKGDVLLSTQVQAIDAIERELKRRYPDVRWSFFEPQVERASRCD
ncbi:cation diffusion facilitator family transporter [Cognatilysobacter lacus]|uniref:Cation diffusion facilitator family transporter n=1 Tax=Cognatilysobacter lacus TaxID=1643323 RepID=A0A5D8YM29_9GAMM|nr:cation diffusion facilitator family transporter [Lysobacter lacus]TZF82923.1 cation diffusion facilitator family transporter [Lysobacter lacus]